MLAVNNFQSWFLIIIISRLEMGEQRVSTIEYISGGTFTYIAIYQYMKVIGRVIA